MRRLIILILLISTLGIVNGMVWHKENLIRNGDRIILSLAPVDPLSIMQGDYMVLNYNFPAWISRAEHHDRIPQYGMLVIERNLKNSIAKIIKVYGYDHINKQRINSSQKLKSNQYLMRYKKRRWNGVSFGVRSFFFQQGHQKYYEKAKFADIRVDTNGEFILVDMLNAKLQSIKAIANRGDKE